LRSDVWARVCGAYLIVLAGLTAWPNFSYVASGPVLDAFTLAAVIAIFVWCAATAAAGIGLLLLVRWARWLAIGSLALALCYGLVVYGTLAFAHGASALLIGLPNAVLPGAALWYLTRKSAGQSVSRRFA
jgi:hypothetical protein